MNCDFKIKDGFATCINCGFMIKYDGKKLFKKCKKRKGKPGSELKKLLSILNLEVTEDCECNKHAQQMDEMGIEWCENNISLIVEWLSQEAKKRKLPFIKLIGKQIVKRAIANAKKGSTKNNQSIKKKKTKNKKDCGCR